MLISYTFLSKQETLTMPPTVAPFGGNSNTKCRFSPFCVSNKTLMERLGWGENKVRGFGVDIYQICIYIHKKGGPNGECSPSCEWWDFGILKFH